MCHLRATDQHDVSGTLQTDRLGRSYVLRLFPLAECSASGRDEWASYTMYMSLGRIGRSLRLR